LRQAYDYWQNQPGNYRGRTGKPMRAPPDVPRGVRVVTEEGTRTDPSAQLAATPGRKAAGRLQAIQLPPLNFPKDGPPQMQRRAREGHLLPATCIPREGTPGRLSRPERRLLALGGPQVSYKE